MWCSASISFFFRENHSFWEFSGKRKRYNFFHYSSSTNSWAVKTSSIMRHLDLDTYAWQESGSAAADAKIVVSQILRIAKTLQETRTLSSNSSRDILFDNPLSDRYFPPLRSCRLRIIDKWLRFYLWSVLCSHLRYALWLFSNHVTWTKRVPARILIFCCSQS